MIRGLYVAGTGMMVQRRLMETVTNNITNVETTGYKKNYLITHSFDEVMLERTQDAQFVGMKPQVGNMTFGALVDQVYQDFSQGSFENTGRMTDLALVGDGFFVVSTPEGERYTRAGAFAVTADGYLCDPNGNYLLGRNGRINVGNNAFAVDEFGTVTANERYVDTIRTVSFADNNTLRSMGGNLFSATAGAIEGSDAKIKQGFIENSNVAVSREMVDMITVFRAYETNQKILTMIDETLGRAVNEIGALR